MITMSQTGEPPYIIESVDGALRILRMLCEYKQIRLSVVAEELHVARSTAHRLLAMLVHHGFARQDEKRGEYKTGPMLLEMGFAAVRDLEMRQYARPILEDLRDRVNETVHLGMPYGQEVLYVEGVESRQQLRIGSRVGTFLPAHCVGLGKALLATLPTEELRVLYPGDELRVVTERSVRSRSELERQLDEIRERGYAASRAESTDGVGSIAVAVLDPKGSGRAAISVSAPLTRITPEAEARWVDAARNSAERLGALLWRHQASQ